MSFMIVFSFFAFSKVATALEPFNFDVSSCIVEHLKENGMLDQNFPAPNGYFKDICVDVMSNFKNRTESDMRALLLEETKKGCIMQEFGRARLIETLLKENVVDIAAHITEEEQKIKIQAVKHEVSEILGSTAKKCHSNSSYGEAFDDFIGHNSTSIGKPSTQEVSYCLTKFVIDHNFTDLENVNVNPENISTTNINCDTILAEQITRTRNEAEESFKKENVTSRALNCSMEIFDSRKIYEMAWIDEVLEMIDIPEEDKFRNQLAHLEKIVTFHQSRGQCPQ